MNDEIDLTPYEHYWLDRDGGWVLLRYEDGDFIVGNLHDKCITIIEDDSLSNAIEQEMLRHGVPVVDSLD